MIVRNESAVIERCIGSVRELIDTWVICDTGSEDGTQEIIRRALADVPGTLHEVEWRNFGHNRTELARLARGAADYLLMLDADDTIRVVEPMPETLTADSYLIQHSGEMEFYLKRLVRSEKTWTYVGATHEYPMTEEQDDEQRLNALVIDHHADGGARAAKFERDAQLLEEELERDASSERSVFYLAQTYRDMDKKQQAVELYRRRAGMGGFAEEVFYSLYQAGVLLAELDEWPLGMQMLIAAFEYRPSRIEPLYELSSRLRMREEYETAHLFATRGVGRPVPTDVLFLHPWIYRWGMLFEYSITSYWTGQSKVALRACNALLAMPDLPPTYREQTKANKRFCLQRVTQATAERRGPGTSTPLPTPRRR